MSEAGVDKANILIVSGSAAEVDLWAAHLSGRGYQVRSAHNGQAALAAARDPYPDLILIGSQLSDMASNRLHDLMCEQAETKETPVVLLGAPVQTEVQGRALSGQASGYVTMRMRGADLTALVDSHLSLAAVLRELHTREAQLEQEATWRRQTERAIVEGERTGQRLIENLNDVIYSADAEGIVTYVSPGIERLLGYLPSEVVGRRLQEFVHPEGLPRLEAALQSILTGRPAANEYPGLTKSGEARWMRTSSQPILEGGRVVGVQGVLSDVTERKHVEQQLQEQNEFLTSVLESLTHPFYVVNVKDYSIQIANWAARKAAKDARTTCYALAHNRDAPCDGRDHPCPIVEIKRTRQPVTVEHVHYGPDGAPRNVQVHGYPIWDEDGNLERLIEYVLDVTEQKQAEAGLRQAKEEADRARREEGRRRRVAESLAGVLSALNSNRALDEVLDYIVAQARELLESDACAIYSQRDGAHTFAPQASWGLTDCVSHEGPWPGALHHAVSSRQAVVLADTDAVPATGGEPSFVSPRKAPAAVTIDRCRALLAVPVIVKERVYGALALYYSEPHAFAEEQIELASLVSAQVALAVENARLRDQVQEAAVAAERNRLARDLHDSVTQALFSASLVAEVLPNVWRRDPAQAEQGLAELRLLTRGALAEMRTLLLELRPNALVQTSLEDLLWQLTEGLASRVQMVVKFTSERIPDLPPDAQIAFYRVAQEALNNVTKHAEASRALVSLRASPPVTTARSEPWMGEIVLQVSDDGRGFDVNHVGSEQLGLRIMRERADSVGATLTVDSRPGHGTRVTLVWCGSDTRLTTNAGSYSRPRSEP